jgi:hypothetical protein
MSEKSPDETLVDEFLKPYTQRELDSDLDDLVIPTQAGNSKVWIFIEGFMFWGYKYMVCPPNAQNNDYTFNQRTKILDYLYTDLDLKHRPKSIYNSLDIDLNIDSDDLSKLSLKV